MPRAVNKVAAKKRKKKLFDQAKGFWGKGKNVYVFTRNRLEKGWGYAYRDRKGKKRLFRALWIQRINAAARMYGMSYSEFMGKIHTKGIALNRKALADIAMNDAEAFKAVVEKLSKTG